MSYRPIFLIALSMTLLVVGDVGAKFLTQAGVSSSFTAWARFALGVILVVPFCRIQRDEWRHFLNWRILLRGAMTAGAIGCLVAALKTEPIANVFGAFFVAPIVSYALSVLILKEQVTTVRSILLAISFVGVLLVVRPTLGVSIGMAFALAAGIFQGNFLVATRALAPFFRLRFLLISQLIIATVMLAPLAIGPLPQFTASLTGFILLSAAGSAAGNLILLYVNRTTLANIVAPLIYSQLIAALCLGWLVFGEVPDGVAFAGILIILAAGLSSYWLAYRGLKR